MQHLYTWLFYHTSSAQHGRVLRAAWRPRLFQLRHYNRMLKNAEPSAGVEGVCLSSICSVCKQHKHTATMKPVARVPVFVNGLREIWNQRLRATRRLTAQTISVESVGKVTDTKQSSSTTPVELSGMTKAANFLSCAGNEDWQGIDSACEILKW